jgi:hypothetical protein
MTIANIQTSFQAIGLIPFDPAHVLNKIRPEAPPIRYDMSNPKSDTVTQVAQLIEESFTNIPARGLRAIVDF